MSQPSDPIHPSDEARLRRNLRRAGFVGAGLAALIVLGGALARFSQATEIDRWTDAEDIATVALVTPEASAKNQALQFPGTLAAYYDADIYARVPGYVHAWYQDIGAHVHKDQPLASIDTPELDQQIAQARADLDAAEAAEKLSAVTAQRWESLLPLDAVSKQDVEDKQEDLESKKGALKGAQANLDRLQALKGFAQIVAPFDGVVTRRSIDVGALVNAGSPASNNEPLFAVSDIHLLRLYVNVPQSYSAQIVPGMTVSLAVPEYPGRLFAARLLSTANAIGRQSGSLLVEFEADNSHGLLKPGDYAQVNLGLPNTASMLRLPASALIFRAQGLEVAVLGADGRIHMKPITVTTDLGTEVIVSSGIGARDRVVNNPPDSIANGEKVRVADHA